MAGVWPPEISIVFHRHNQGGANPLNFQHVLLFCALRGGDTNQILLSAYLLKVKIFAPPKISGWLRYCWLYFVDPTFPESKSKVLLKLHINL